MADYCIIALFVFRQELFSAWKRYLIYVFIHVLLSHSNAGVANGKGLVVLVNGYFDCKIIDFTAEIAMRGQCAKLLSCIDGIWNELAKKYLVVAVKKLFNYGENVVGCYPNFTFCHNCYVLYYFFDFLDLMIFEMILSDSLS